MGLDAMPYEWIWRCIEKYTWEEMRVKEHAFSDEAETWEMCKCLWMRLMVVVSTRNVARNFLLLVAAHNIALVGDRKSITSCSALIGGNLISWKRVVARPSTETKYCAMANTACELFSLKHLLQELKFCELGHMKLSCDNQSISHLSSNPIFHEITKHIEIDSHFIREKILSGTMKTTFVGFKE